ncbi:MAG TPA: hypothetical protein VM619_14610 [Luteimonas sp.]|nr:hypothetical protein [Luteimonas sp.]
MSSAKMPPMLPIPVSAAETIAKNFGYDQVIVIARRVGEPPAPAGEHVTTYGRNSEHCCVAARVGNFLKHKVMDWPEYEGSTEASLDNLRQLAEALEMPEDYGLVEFLPGQWSFQFERADGEVMACGTNWNHPALAACAAWGRHADALRPAGPDNAESTTPPAAKDGAVDAKLRRAIEKVDLIERYRINDGNAYHDSLMIVRSALVEALAASAQQAVVSDAKVDRVTDYLCEQEYDIGGRAELRKHVAAALRSSEVA